MESTSWARHIFKKSVCYNHDVYTDEIDTGNVLESKEAIYITVKTTTALYRTWWRLRYGYLHIAYFYHVHYS